MSTIDELFISNCLKYSKNHKKISKFANKNEFCDRRINKFCLMLRKGVYPYKYMDSWKGCDKTQLPDKEDFCSNLNMEDIRNTDYKCAKKACKIFEINNFGEYHDLYVQSNTLSH